MAGQRFRPSYKITQPVLLMHGENDLTSHIKKIASKWAPAMPGCKCEVIRNAHLTESRRPATTTAIAERLGIGPASVTGMVQQLSSVSPALVSYRRHQGVTLIAAGRRGALEVIRHHRLVEAWLVHSLGYAWDEVHCEAEKLEHVISEDFDRRVAAALGHPERDPHGMPIPSPELVMPEDTTVSLALRNGNGPNTRLRRQVNGGRPTPPRPPGLG